MVWLVTLEWVAAVFGFVAVALTVARSVWCWPVGLVQVVLYVRVFYDSRLYSDMLLHVVFAWLQVYGWYHWYRSERLATSAPQAARIQSLTPSGCLGSLGLCVSLSLAIGWAMRTWTDAALPWADAFIAGTSLVAQWQLAHKYLQNWYLWIAIDIVAIYVFSIRELWPTAALYGLFLIMSILGAMVWIRQWRLDVRKEIPQ